MIEHVKSQRLFAASFVVLYLLQNEVIYPIESFLRTDQYAYIVSFLYLPHGLKVFCGLVLGIWSLPLIFLAQTFNTIYFTGSFDLPSFWSSTLAMVSIGIPIILFNRTVKQSVKTPPLCTNIIIISSFWLYASFAFISAMLNSFMQTFVYGLPNSALSWYFLFGDILGSIVFYLLLVIFFKLINKSFLKKIKGMDL